MSILRRSFLLGGATALSGCAAFFNRYAEPDLTGVQASRLTVHKADRIMLLEADGKVVKTYKIALGFAPEGPKQFYGDGRTPEGLYRINRRNPRSAFHLSLGISYPSEEDRERALALGVDPGGDIFIHGRPNSATEYPVGDWTLGCIAVRNAEIEELWQVTPLGCPIQIEP